MAGSLTLDCSIVFLPSRTLIHHDGTTIQAWSQLTSIRPKQIDQFARRSVFVPLMKSAMMGNEHRPLEGRIGVEVWEWGWGQFFGCRYNAHFPTLRWAAVSCGCFGCGTVSAPLSFCLQTSKRRTLEKSHRGAVLVHDRPKMSRVSTLSRLHAFV